MVSKRVEECQFSQETHAPEAYATINFSLQDILMRWAVCIVKRNYSFLLIDTLDSSSIFVRTVFPLECNGYFNTAIPYGETQPKHVLFQYF